MSPCSKTCGMGGTQQQTRSIITRPVNGGAKCPSLVSKASCIIKKCPETCTGGRVWMGVSQKGCFKRCNKDGSIYDPSLIGCAQVAGQECRCPEPKFDAWDPVSQRCVKPCPKPRLPTPAPTARNPVDCKVSGWSAMSPCSKTCGMGGTQQQTRSIITRPVNGGAKCPSLVSKASCIIKKCPETCTGGRVWMGVSQKGCFKRCNKDGSIYDPSLIGCAQVAGQECRCPEPKFDAWDPVSQRCVKPCPKPKPDPVPTPAPTPRGAHVLPVCKHVICSYSNGNTIVTYSSFFAPSQEKWHCEKKGNDCVCSCHPKFKCTLNHHHTSGYQKAIHHC